KGLAAGICGSISAHSASVTSLAYRCPSRSYFRRVISVHILCLDDCFTTTIMPQPTEITQFIFGQPLRLLEFTIKPSWSMAADNGASDIRHGWWHRLRRL